MGDSCPQPRLYHGIPWGAFIKCQCQGPTQDQLNHNLWGWDLDTGNVFNSSNGSNVQAGRITTLLLCCHLLLSGFPLLFPTIGLLSITRCQILSSPRCTSTLLLSIYHKASPPRYCPLEHRDSISHLFPVPMPLPCCVCNKHHYLMGHVCSLSFPSKNTRFYEGKDFDLPHHCISKQNRVGIQKQF